MASPECNICGSTQSKLCTKCRSSAYCTVECQRADLPSHKLLCAEIASSTRPGPGSKRAILFPASSDSPKLIWVECQEKDNGAGESVEYPNVVSYLGGEGSTPEFMDVEYNSRRKREMKDSLRFMFQAGSLAEEQNKSITKAIGRPPRAHWGGPVVVLRKRGKDTDHYEDITLQDYRQAIDHLLWYKTDDGKEDPIQSVEKVQGVRINCLGDRWHFKMEKYTPVEVPGEHPVYRAPVAPMSEIMGIPLRVMKYPLHPKWKGTWINGEFSSDNPSATYMYADTNPSSQWWGFAPAEWQRNVGSVVVVRDDRVPLTPEQTMCLCDFFQFEMGQYFEDSNPGGWRTKEQVLGFLTRKRFESSWKEMKEMLAPQKYLNWSVDSKSPYEMTD